MKSQDKLDFEVRVPWIWVAPGKIWRVSAPYLKLALKYGVIGPLQHKPWEYLNRSVAFDAYTLTRGPETGIPDHRDFLHTLEMNSGINGDDVLRFDLWWRDSATQAELRHLREALMTCTGLSTASREVVVTMADFADRMIDDQERLKGMRVAKVFKWLSTWAPAHVPMLDNVLAYDLLIYVQEPYDGLTRLDLLLRFQALLTCTWMDWSFLASDSLPIYQEHSDRPFRQFASWIVSFGLIGKVTNGSHSISGSFHVPHRSIPIW